MQQELTTPQNQENPEFKLSPEQLKIAEVYLQTLDIGETSSQLGISKEEVTLYLRKPVVKRFLDVIFLEQGYRNKHKLGDLLDKIIDEKLEESMETGITSSKDILDVIQIVHKIRMEEIKAAKEAPGNQTNIQVNNGMQSSNLSKLIESLVKD